MKYFFCLLITCGLVASAYSQSSLEEVEVTLGKYAEDLLNHPSLSHKIKQNKRFSQLLIKTLERPESYTYPFDSLNSISILNASDNSFRIFTWQIMNKHSDTTYYGEQSHYYFGLVQRKYQTAQGDIEYIVIPLVELTEIPKGVENMVLDNYNWLGGLYYLPKYSNSITALPFRYHDPSKSDGKGGIKETKQTFYVLMGWNGLDNRSNLKFVDLMSFDPDKKDRVIFGANVFYFDVIPKYRALFRYSEYAPFSLNEAYVRKNRFSKKKMIVFDHLASPKPGDRKLTEVWEMGPDGSYDALRYTKKEGGYFEWYTNVEIAENYDPKLPQSKLTQKQLQQVQIKEQRRQREAGINLSNSTKKNQ